MILNFGSINIDNVYRLASLPKPGETLAAQSFERVLGGKGLNQTVAAMRAKADVLHVGYIGEDEWISQALDDVGVDRRFVQICDLATGHAVINVSDDGENEIVIFAGANGAFDISSAKRILEECHQEKAWVVLQNEINLSVDIAKLASELGYRICYSAAPFDADHVKQILPYVDLLAVNETEFEALSLELGEDAVADVPMVLITFGKKGAKLRTKGQESFQPSFDVKAVDTTGAGDTFLGSFIARFSNEESASEALRYAAAAAALQVTKHGATPAIPSEKDVHNFLSREAK